LIDLGGNDEPRSLHFYHEAVENYLNSLELLPPDDATNRVVAYNGLGMLRTISGDTEGALKYFWEATQLLDAAGRHLEAGKFRSNIAATLYVADRFGDALEYAHSALRDFQTAGENTEHEIQATLEFIRMIEQSIRARGRQADG
jgi:tetratricopeptide (TPR) repeat protein